jgi:hypothetical protein
MDLFTLRSGEASFNPFTALIGLESLGGSRELSLAIPVIEDPQIARYSVLFHEVTHLWTMRMTTLGVVLSIAAARAWNEWRAHPNRPVELPERVFHLLGTWLPILEGLATYAELDYSGDEDRDRIHSPLLKVIHFTAPAIKGVANDQEFLHTRLSRVVVDRLLAQLLLEPSIQPNEHAYFTGYLYVKTLASRLGTLCPPLSPPGRMLPLLIRLLCDHPATLRSQTADHSTAELLGAVHESALSLDASLLHKIAGWIETGDPQEVVWRFDFLDLERSRKAGELVFHEYDRQDFRELVADDLIPMLNLFRRAGSFYLPAWKSGVLQSIDEGSFTLRHGSEDVEYRMLSAADFQRRNPGGRARVLASRLLDSMLTRLRQAIGREVTAALYIDMASGDPGMVFWVDGQLAIASPYSLCALERGGDTAKQFEENLVRGHSLAPTMRGRFGAAIRTPAVFPRAAVEASRWHLAQMISSPRGRDRVLQHKLRSIENGGFLSEMYDWCAPPLQLALPPMPEEIAAAMDRIFDFPGFSGSQGAPRLAELMPVFSVKPGK